MSEVKEVKLLKIETKFDMTKGDIGVTYACTGIFEDIMKDAGAEKDVVETLTKIEIMIDDLMTKINDNMKVGVMQHV